MSKKYGSPVEEGIEEGRGEVWKGGGFPANALPTLGRMQAVTVGRVFRGGAKAA